MKKITLIVCALALSVATFAGVQNVSKKLVKNSDVPSVRIMQAEFNPAAEKATSALDTLLVPYALYNVESYQVGCPADGLSYSYYQQGWVTPFADTLIFLNSALSASTWLVDGVEVASEIPYYFQPAGFGEHAMPLMKMAKSDTAAYLDYQVAGLFVADWHAEGHPEFYTATSVAPTFASFTKCSMYTEDARNSKYGQDWHMVGGGSIGTYSYGSQLTNPWDGGYFDTILVPFVNEGPLFINDITAAVYNKTSMAAMFPAETDHIRLSVFPMDAEGNINWETPIATATANADNFTPYSSSYSNLGLLQFNFLEEDPITGALTATPITVEGNFVLAFDEFNDGTASVGFISDYHNTTAGQTYFVGRDSETGEQYITGLWITKHNILVNIDGVFPTFNAPETIAFAGGVTEKTIEVPTNIFAEDVEEIETEDWIEVELETVLDSNEEHSFVDLLKVTVDASDEARAGLVTIYALGTEFKFVVSQNGGTLGVESVKAVNDNKLYNVLGIEVGEDYKGIVIRNGEKFIK